MNKTQIFKITDARGSKITITHPALRIISLIPSITETFFDLGAGENIAGRTRYCIKPVGLVEKIPVIGGTKDPDIEKIAAIKPDVVFANIEENEKEDIDKLESRNIPVFVTHPRTLDDSLELIKTLGLISGAEKTADVLYKEAESVMTVIRDNTGIEEHRPKVLYLIWRNPWMTINHDTYIGDIITFCGGINVFAGTNNRYPEITIENMVNSAPDIIILPSEPYKFKERHAGELRVYPEIPAVKNNRILFADGEMFSWFGTRMIPALKYAHELMNRKIN